MVSPNQSRVRVEWFAPRGSIAKGIKVDRKPACDVVRAFGVVRVRWYVRMGWWLHHVWIDNALRARLRHLELLHPKGLVKKKNYDGVVRLLLRWGRDRWGVKTRMEQSRGLCHACEKGVARTGPVSSLGVNASIVIVDEDSGNGEDDGVKN